MKLKQIRKFAYLLAIALTVGATTASAQGSPSDSWEWGAELYFWGASLGGSTTTGSDIDLDIDEIIEDLKFGVMGTVAAQKGDWRLFADLIYLDIGDSENASVSIGGVPALVSASIDLKGVISTAGVGYRIYEQSGTRLDVTGAVRYLWLDSRVDVGVGTVSVREDDAWSNWDAVVGFRGKTDLSDQWYLSYYADVGAGQSDLTWQALATVNYRMSKADLALGYRYLDWDFDDFGPFNDLNLSGAFVGVKIPF